MPHAGPDWGTYAPVSTIYSLQDLGELAARLGSIDTFDRRGNVIYIENFESGLGLWGISGTTPGYSGRWCPDFHRSGGFCVELNTAAAAGAAVDIEGYLPYPSKSRLGIELHFNHTARVAKAEFLIEVYDGVNLYEAYIQLVGSTWQYWGDDHAWHNLSPTTDLMTNQIFHAFKLVFDLTTGKFVRLIVDTTIFDLSTHNIYKTGSSNAPCIYFIYEITSSIFAQAAYAWLDDLILTQNEP
jgi:hypothetical protein